MCVCVCFIEGVSGREAEVKEFVSESEEKKASDPTQTGQLPPTTTEVNTDGVCVWLDVCRKTMVGR